MTRRIVASARHARPSPVAKAAPARDMPMSEKSESKPRTKLRDAMRERPTLSESRALQIAFLSENSPLCVAIYGQALIESDLDQILRFKLPRNDDGTWIRLTDVGGPLETFNAKILLGYALRLYDDHARTNLNIIKNIRNFFAHSQKILDFNSLPIRNELNKIVTIGGKRSRHYRHLSVAKTHKTGVTLALQNRVAYIMLCITMRSIITKINI